MNTRPNNIILTLFNRETTLRLVWISGIFSAFVILTLSWYGLRFRPIDYLDAVEVLAMKETLKKNPGDEALTAFLREDDLVRRNNYFRSRDKLVFGGYLLFCGLTVFILSLRRLAVLSEKLPVPFDLGEPKVDERRTAFRATLALPLPVAFATFVAFALWPSAEELEGKAATPDGQGEETTVVAIEILPEEERWIQWRGNNGLGTSPDLNVPLSWDAETGENILWKTPVPLKGHSSPVVWGDKVFLTGADVEERKVYCYDISDGTQLWETVITTNVVVDEDMKKTERTGDAGFGSPTPVTDGRHVYAFFGTNELAAIDYEGKQVWSKWLGKPDSFYGVATSLCYHDKKVILQLDQGDEDEPHSFLYAFNPNDGSLVWKTERDVGASWAAPIVIDTGTREEIITAANPWVIAYDPLSGREFWRAKVLRGDVAPLPAYTEGLVFTALEYSQLAAIQTAGSGDVTDTHVRWTYDEDLPDIPSPVAQGNRLLLPTSFGMVNCFDAKTGNDLWSEEFDDEFWSSPVVVGGNVYLTGIEGTTYVFPLADTYESAGTGNLGEKVVTTPAFVKSRIIIRGEESLFCIGSKS